MADYNQVTKKFVCECGCGEEVGYPFCNWVKGHQNRGRVWDEDTKDRISGTLSGRFRSDEDRRSISRGTKQSYLDDPTRAIRHSEVVSGRVKSSKEIRNISEAARDVWRRLTPEDRLIRMGKFRSGRRNKPNKAELLLDSWLQEDFLGEWKYVGDGQVWIEGRNPDFINVNGIKAVIELFGSYWHELSEVTASSKSEKSTIEHYNRYGFYCLVVWFDKSEDLILEWSTIRKWIGGLNGV